MASAASTSEAADDKPSRILMATIVASVRGDDADLSLRQLAVFLKSYLERDIVQTVHGLAAALNISKPTITRVLDRLSAFGLVKRERDAIDRRSIRVRRTSAGVAYFRALDKYFAEAAQI